MRKNRLPNRNQRKGISAVELAVSGILLGMMLFGASDFARIFYDVVTLSNAAGTGAFYGSQSNVTSGQFDVMKQVALNDSQNVTANNVVTATAGRYCDCPNSSGGSAGTVDCVTGTCAGYGAPRVYVDVQATENYQTIVNWPNVPNVVTAGRKAYMRVQ